ncbi:MAG: hypothetical protein HC896_03405 [Bacteroidales bacterium]|nr:hypothetical protein [Bacteroidales bacterium]
MQTSNCHDVSPNYNISFAGTPAADFTYEISNNILSLNNATNHYDSVSWIFNNIYTSTENNPSYDVGTEGTCTVELNAFYKGCQSAAMQTIQVGDGVPGDENDLYPDAVVNESMAILGPENLCATDEGHGFSLVTENEYERYVWSVSPAYAGTIDNNGLHANLTMENGFNGTVEVKVYGCNSDENCEAVSLTYNYQVVENTQAAFEQNVIEYSVSLINATTRYDSLHWVFDDETLTRTHPVKTFGQEGVYDVNLIAYYQGCVSSKQDIVTIGDGVPDNLVYPDAKMSENLNISGNATLCANQGNYSFEVQNYLAYNRLEWYIFPNEAGTLTYTQRCGHPSH